MKFSFGKKTLLVHVLVWCCYIALGWVQFYMDFKSVPVQFYYGRIFSIVIFYINYLYLVPRFLLKRNIKFYILSVVLLLIVNSLLHSFIEPDFRHMQFDRINEVTNKVEEFKPVLPNFEDFKDFKDAELRPKPKLNWVFKYGMPSLIPLLLIVIGAIIRMYAEWKETEDLKKEIAAKKVSSELQFLKAQLNPHFLFNSLNTIYSLSVKQSVETSDAVINLSEMMRYMLYEADKDLVPLEKELDYVKNYIQLQRLRLADDQEVTLNIHGEYYHKKIQPLLFVSFIENAFKYGTDFTGKTQIKIIIDIKGDTLTFFCENVIGRVAKDKKNSGIGLENVKGRLNLLYPNNHELAITNNGKMFTVNLQLKFSKP